MYMKLLISKWSLQALVGQILAKDFGIMFIWQLHVVIIEAPKVTYT